MIYERVMLPTSEGGNIPMDIYVPHVSNEIDPDIKRTTVVIYPGGGYSFTSEREAEPLALRLAAFGFNACVVWYRVKPAIFPAEYQDAASALAYMRANAEKYHADPHRIAVMGFSAGGHLAACAGTLWEDEKLMESLGFVGKDVRPDAMILGYPVVTYQYEDENHVISECFVNLTGSRKEEDWKPLALENRVTGATPPAFIWSTWDDEIVPVENSLVFASALKKAGVKAELHIYPHGYHGASLSDCTTDKPEKQNQDVQNWIYMAIRFLREL